MEAKFDVIFWLQALNYISQIGDTVSNKGGKLASPILRLKEISVVSPKVTTPRLPRILFPKGMDANEYGCKVTPAAKSLAVLVNKAEWVGKGKRPTAVVGDPLQIAVQAEDKRLPAAKEEKPEGIPSLAAESVPPAAGAIPTASATANSSTVRHDRAHMAIQPKPHPLSPQTKQTKTTKTMAAVIFS